MSGLGTFGGSWIAIAWTFFFGLRRMAEVKFPNMEDGFDG